MSEQITVEVITEYEAHGMEAPFVRLSHGTSYIDFTSEQAKVFGFQMYSLALEAQKHEQ